MDEQGGVRLTLSKIVVIYLSMGINSNNTPAREMRLMSNRKIDKSIKYIGVVWLALSCATATRNIIKHETEKEADYICGDGRVGVPTRWSFIEDKFGLDDPLKIAQLCDAERPDQVQSLLTSIATSEDVSSAVREKALAILAQQ